MTGDADRCIKCGSCLRACPVMDLVGEGVFPGPRSLAVEGIRERRSATRSMDEALLCSMCHACEAACPVRIDLPLSMLRLRKESRPGQPLRPGHARMVANIDAHRTSVEPSGVGSLPGDPDSKTCYFSGCVARHRQPSVALSALGLISHFGSPAACPDELVCCGSPLEKIGDEDRRKGLQGENALVLERFDRIIASCPGCTAQLVEHYGLDVMHLTEYLYEEVGLRRLASSVREVKADVAVHHPCHLNRLVGAHTKEYTIQLLQALPGVRLIEYDGEDSCCGAGGSLLSGFPEVAGALGQRKTALARDAGAEILLAACPFCVTNLGRSGTIPTMDLGQFIMSRIIR